jgi:serine/threonine-protein kinase
MKVDPNIGRVLEGKYDIIRVLGKGGMGVVYEARHRLINRRLAVKLLHAEFAEECNIAERFRREAKAASAIGHDHIVDITDMGFTDQGELFIAMEYLEGEDLSNVLQEVNRFTPQRACHIMIQVLSALEAAHSKGIVHRDLKPANIFLLNNRGAEDYVKLVDFGISKMEQSDDDMRHNLTRTGELLGTPSFMSPEQARGETDITPQSDIFSAGLILYRLLTGRTAFDDKALTMLLMKILTETPPVPQDLIPDIPTELSDAVMRAIAKEPQDRFPDAASFRRVLQRFSPDTPFQTGLGVTRYTDSSPRITTPEKHSRSSFTAVTPTALAETRGPSGQSKLVIPLAVIIVIAIISGAGIFAYYQKSNPSHGAGQLTIPGQQTIPGQIAGLQQNMIPKQPPTSTTDAAGKEALPQTITFEVRVTPNEATVSVDGVVQGMGSMVLHPVSDNKEHLIQVWAPGFSSSLEQVMYDRNLRLTVHLSPAIEITKSFKPGGSGKTQKNPGSGKVTTSEPKDSEAKTPSDQNQDNSANQDNTGNNNPDQDNKPIRKIDEVNPW